MSAPRAAGRARPRPRARPTVTAAPLLGMLVGASLVVGGGGVLGGGRGDPSPVSLATAGASSAGSPTPSPTRTRRVRPAQTLPPLEPLPRLDPAVARPALGREVVAYLPYWMARPFQATPAVDPATDPWITDRRLTDIVLFAVGVRRDGSLQLDEPGGRFVLGPFATRVIKAAHAHGIRVLVSFFSGGFERNKVLFREEAAQLRFVREATALVRLRGLDGADLDVEQINAFRFPGFARTAAALRASLLRENPRARVTVATNGNRSGARMAAMALSMGVDRAFLMGYAYRGRTSNPVGSISPLRMADDLDLLDSLALYRSVGVDARRVLLGLPTYGLTWPTTGPEAHAPRADADRYGAGRVTTFFQALGTRSAIGAVLDQAPDDPSAFLRWQEPGRRVWWQSWVDTPATWRPKLLAAITEDLAGVGIWAHGYTGGLTGFPDMIDEVLGRPVVAGGAITPAVTRSLDVRVSARFEDVLASTRLVQLSNDGRTWSPPLAPGALRSVRWRLAAGPDGERRVLVRSQDERGAWSVPYALVARVDRTGPRLALLATGQVAGRWQAQVAATDGSGIARLRLRWRDADGGWSPWRELREPGDALLPAGSGDPSSVEVEAIDRLGNRSRASTAP